MANGKCDRRFRRLEYSWHPLQVYLVDALNPDSRPLLVEERQEGVEYFVEHDRGPLLILTNAGGAVNNKLMMAPASCPQMQCA